MGQLKIFLGDLIHNQHIGHYCVPLNIGYVPTTLKQRFGTLVETRMFKYPDLLIDSLTDPPDILALSNYDWNVRLNRIVIALARERNPDILVVMGGPNIRKSRHGIKQFLLNSPEIDVYIVNEGESGFAALIELLLGVMAPCSPKDSLVKACVELPNVALLADDGAHLLMGNNRHDSLADPIPYPSPWLSGLMDSFLNSTSFPLAPIIETNRGCPYQCYFCTWGSFEDRRIRAFPLDIVLAELRVIFERAKNKFHLYIGDGNFGILRRDIRIAEEIRKLSDKYKNLLNLRVSLTKSNNLKRNLEILRILGDICIPDLALQSLNEEALKNVGRKNISASSIRTFIHETQSRGSRVYTDLLVGLPGETRQSHINNIRKAMDMGFYFVNIAEIRLLMGSRMAEDDYISEHAIKARYRAISSAYGSYGGRKVVEYERGIRQTSTMTEDDLLYLRLFHAYLYFLMQLEFAKPLYAFATKHGIHPVDLTDRIASTPSAYKFPLLFKEIEDYSQRARAEWFDTEQEASEYYLSEDVFKTITEKGIAKLNVQYAAQLILNLPLRRELFHWIVKNIKDALPMANTSIVEDISCFAMARLTTWPIENVDYCMRLSRDSFSEIAAFVSHSAQDTDSSKTSITVKFSFDQPEPKSLIDRHHGETNISGAIESVLLFNHKVFIADISCIME